MIFPYVFINGKIVDKQDALIPVWDLGLLRGLGVFDFFRVLEGVAVFAEDHIERLQNSLRITGLYSGTQDQQWMDWINELISVNHADRAGFRVVVTGGFSEDGYSLPDEKNIYLMLHHLPENDPTQYSNGVSLLTSSYQRDIPAAKTTIYIQSMSFQPELKRSGAFEVLYHWKGEIRECSRCNIFFIDQDNVIHTPRNEMLRGITRKQVIALAAAHELPLVERDINMDEIPTMAGAFLTATTKGVLPVVRIDQQIIGDGQVHPLAQKLQSLYEKRVREYLVKALQKQS